MEEEILDNLGDLIDKWEDEIEDLERLVLSSPELENDCDIKKETLEEVVRDIKFLISEFTVVE